MTQWTCSARIQTELFQSYTCQQRAEFEEQLFWQLSLRDDLIEYKDFVSKHYAITIPARYIPEIQRGIQPLLEFRVIHVYYGPWLLNECLRVIWQIKEHINDFESCQYDLLGNYTVIRHTRELHLNV